MGNYITPRNGKKLNALARRLDGLQAARRAPVDYAAGELLAWADDACQALWTREDWDEYRWGAFRLYRTPEKMEPEKNRIRRRLWAKYRDAVAVNLMGSLTMMEKSQQEKLVGYVMQMMEAMDAYAAAKDAARALLEEIPREQWPDEWTPPWEER